MELDLIFKINTKFYAYKKSVLLLLLFYFYLKLMFKLYKTVRNC